MNILENVSIKGLWDRHSVDLTLYPDVNFLIGPNGCGKTTIINLIVAVLTADFRPLLRTSYSTIEIKMKKASGRRKPTIRVEKKFNAPRTVSILYKVRESASAEWEEYFLEDVEELLRYRYMSRRRQFIVGDMPDIIGLKRRLDSFYNLTWLSIHRAKSFRQQEEEDSYDSTVDNKLMDMSNELVRFFSALTKKASAEMEKFQESVFLSLLQEYSEEVLTSSLRGMDFKAERTQLLDIYEKLHVDPSQSTKAVDVHFKNLEQAYEAVKKHTISARDLVVINTNFRIHHIIEDWTKLIQKQKDIYEPRESFLSIVNDMMLSKFFFLNNKEELCVKMDEGRDLRLTDLSSGEKQMLIILGEALLEQRAPSIYIADEPELSLHVEWQQSLINNIRTINPQTQIVFATHSPDIVSVHDSRVHSLMEILK